MVNVLMSRGILGSDMLFEELKDVIKKEHVVSILLYSFFDDQFLTKEAYHLFYQQGSEYYEKMIGSFSPYGIQESSIQWIYYDTPTEEAIQMIKKSDILYFPGGAPDQMMERFKDKNLIQAIEEHQKIYIGSSAGAMIQFEDYHISADAEYPKFSYEKGLNLLKGFSIEVHYRRRKKQKSGMRKVFRAYRHAIFTIPDDGALVCYDDEIIMLGNADLLYDHRGII